MSSTVPPVPPQRYGVRRRTVAVAVSVTAMALGAVAAPAAVNAVSPSRVVPVSSVAALRTAVANALPGDRIELADGRYSVSTPIELRRPGTVTAPVTVAAAHVGKAEITGSVGFKVSASDVVIEGFRFTHGTGLSVPVAAQRVRVTRNVFQLTSTVKNWLTVSGNDARVDHNTFQNKSTVGVFLQVAGPGETGMAQRVRVDHNYFVNHSYTGGNGGESIRFGVSTRQHASAYGLVEHNLFSAANGDVEAISVKSSDNVIRYNRIERSRGTVTLRHGDRNRVEGNLLIGGSTGIRVFGNDHTVVNNVVQSSTGRALSVPNGDLRDDTTGTIGQDAADRVLVAFNTLAYNAAVPIQLGTTTDPYAPSGINVANNVVTGQTATVGSPAVRLGTGVGATWSANLLHNLTGAGLPTTGYWVANPLLVKDTAGIYRLSTGSPAIAVAARTEPAVALDMDGQARPLLASVGADEVADGPATVELLMLAAVGPTAP